MHGDSDKSSLVGLFGIDPEGFAPFASKAMGKKFAINDFEGLKVACQDERVRKQAMKELETIARKNKLNRYEYCRALYLYLEPFTETNGLLTPTMKLKRSHTAKWYRQHLDELYAEVEAEEKKKGPKAKL